jgi:hypothetical protein
MKKIILASFFLMALYAAAFAVGQSRRMHSPFAVNHKESFLDNHFNPTHYPLQSRFFTVCVVGFNNGASVERTLRSIFSQHYENYRLIYIDDASNDGSVELVRDLLQESGQIQKVTLVQNKIHLGELANLSSLIRQCLDHEIIVWVGGDDWLAHEWVLDRLNEYYADPDLWMTYGQHREFPTYELGICAPFNKEEWEGKGFRGYPFAASHVQTFYAGLFKQIKEADFTFQGNFLPARADLAIMLPLLELARHHFQFIPDILYIVNTKHLPLQEEAEMLSYSEQIIRSFSPYVPLSSFPLKESNHE